jgi:tRNA(adenine34) deaminase
MGSCLARYVAPVTSGPIDDQTAMAIALAEAAAAGSRGDVPVGAVVVLDGEVVSRAGNEREQRGDPTAHAEVLALRAAAAAVGSWRLDGATLVVTLEPCPMCAGALLAARVARVVFGAANTDNGSCGSLYNLCVDPRLNHEVEVVAGIEADRAAALLDGFFAARRP